MYFRSPQDSLQGCAEQASGCVLPQKTLTQCHSCTCNIVASGKTAQVDITRDKFEALCERDFQRVHGPLERVRLSVIWLVQRRPWVSAAQYLQIILWCRCWTARRPLLNDHVVARQRSTEYAAWQVWHSLYAVG